MRNAAIHLRALPEQRDLIDQAARLLGKNRSDFVLEAACDKAQSVLLDQVFWMTPSSGRSRPCWTRRFNPTQNLSVCWRSRPHG
jgi:Protein of unknown function (DUF1778)